MPSVSERTGQAYWRSLNELAETEDFREFLHREFPAGAAEMLDSDDRRTFLKLMGASLAMAGLGLAGCRRWPDEKIAPYAHRPAARTPGVPVNYATSMELGGVSSGLLVSSYDGRPIKIEGNPDHPINAGASSLLEQASVLDLYDPDRSRAPRINQREVDWPGFLTWMEEHRSTLGDGDGLRVLSEATGSPSVLDMKRRFMERYPRAVWHEYEAINNDNVVRGAELTFGAPYRAHYDFSQADVIVALDSDFLCSHPASVKHSRDFAARRRRADDDGSMSRLYAFESGLSLTGANADHRVAVKSGDVSFVAAWLASRILHESALAAFENAERATALMEDDLKTTLEHALDDLQGAHGRVVIIAGERQPAEVHMLAHLMNEALGASNTVTYTAPDDQTAQVASLAALCEAMESGGVDTLLILGGNPVYDAPADLDFAGKLARVTNSIHLSCYMDETSAASAWHINRAHFLETWGDGRGYDGTVSLAQPLIEPLFGGKSVIELLAAFVGDAVSSGYDLVRRSFAEMTGGSFDESLGALADDALWRRTLHDGVMEGSAYPMARVSSSTGNRDAAIAGLFDRWNTASGQEIVFVADATLHDGRFANNGWLQELPDPITKLTWDNAVLVNPADAAAMGIGDGDTVRINVSGRTLTMPILRNPGQARDSVTVSLGYGRSMAGRICTGAGFNTYQLRGFDAMGFATGASIEPASGRYPLATTQDHHAIDPNTTGGKGIHERLSTLVREGTLSEYHDHPDFAKHRSHVVHKLSLWDETYPFHVHDGENDPDYAWALSIDLNACTGCSSCVVACQAENNIPIVGKDQVLRGREMHWIRLDRYYRFREAADGSWDNSVLQSVAMQPVTCMQCENAPCEQVCPVAATTHDKDGLNVMVYNRCVGTRYCSNNCPYKVRRFNYFDYHRRKPHREQPGTFMQVEGDYFTKAQASEHPVRNLQFNPEVTVRMRGIMEKCTYCIQRIASARIQAKNEWVKEATADERKSAARVPITDRIITPACAQACPAQAIVFGDMNDPESDVTKLHRHDRTYQMLEELNVKARTRYMAKLRNPAGDAGDHSGGGAGH